VGPINKTVIQLTPRTYAYLLENTREPAPLRACREATSVLRGSQMQVPPEQGALLALLVELSGAQRVLEVGTYTVCTRSRLAANMRSALCAAVARHWLHTHTHTMRADACACAWL
jgi:predicted O-methyltransferase YrrM